MNCNVLFVDFFLDVEYMGFPILALTPMIESCFFVVIYCQVCYANSNLNYF